jgi:bifunctional DNase/RNase
MIMATGTGLVPMRVSKAVGLKDADDFSEFMVLDELAGDRHLVIAVGHAEAFGLAASLQGLQWGRPMTYQFTAALVRGLGGRVREVRLDRIVEALTPPPSRSRVRKAWVWWMPGPAMR